MLFWILLVVALVVSVIFGIHSYNSNWGGLANAVGVFFVSLAVSCIFGGCIWGLVVLSNFESASHVTISSTEYQLDPDAKLNVVGDNVTFVSIQNGSKEAVSYSASVVKVLSANPTKVEIIVFDIVDEQLSPWPLDTQSNVVIK
jgi:hypothetical protein